MSSVDNVILFGVDEDEKAMMDQINSWMRDNAQGQEFREPIGAHRLGWKEEP